MINIRPGLCSVTLRDLSIDDVAELAADCGLEGIEWGGDVHVAPGDARASAAARRACDRHGLEIPSYGSYLGSGMSLDPVEVLDTAVTLGAPNVRIWAGATASEQCSPEQRAAFVCDVSLWCEMAAQRGLMLSLECHAGTLTDTADSTLALIDEVGAANLRTYWQPRDHGRDAGTSDLAELAQLASAMSHVHVFWGHDVLTRFPLADGAAFWSGALGLAAHAEWPAAENAATSPPGRWAFLEFVRGDDPEQLRADAATLISLVGS